MKIGSVELTSPFVVAPMAGMTDTAFRRLVKRHGGCGLVVTEMVRRKGSSAASIARSSTRNTPRKSGRYRFRSSAAIPAKMADAAQIVEGMGADIVDVNMGCPVPKICQAQRRVQPDARARSTPPRVVGAMTKAVKIPVTVKMRAGWNDGDRNAPVLAQMVQDAGAAAVTIHGRTAEQSYTGVADWELVARVAEHSDIPVLGSGDCVEPEQIIERLATGVSGVLVGRGVLRNPWILAQAADVVSRSRGADCEHSTSAGSSCSSTSRCCSTNASTRPTGFATWRPARVSDARRRRTPGARARAVGHQQTSCVVFLVLEGARRWLAAARPREQRGACVSVARDCRRVLHGRNADGPGSRLGPSGR